VAVQRHAVFRGERRVEEFARPPAHAGAVEPLGDGHPVERLRARRIVVRGVEVVGPRLAVHAELRGHGRQRANDFAGRAARAADPPHIGVESCVRLPQIIQLDAQFLCQRPDARVIGVNKLAAEFTHLIISKGVAEREHAAAHALLRFDDADRHAVLTQPIRGGEARDAGADDEHGLDITTWCGETGAAAATREARVERERGGRSGAHGNESAAGHGGACVGRSGHREHAIGHLIQRLLARPGELRDTERPLHQAKEGGAWHGAYDGALGSEVPDADDTAFGGHSGMA